MQLSLRLSFYLRHSFGGYTVGTTAGFLVEIVEALVPQTSPPNPAEVPAVACEQLFRLPLRGHFFVTHSNRKARGLLSGQITPVPRDAIYDLWIWIRPTPSSGKQLGSHTPIPYKAPTTPG
jgi:hypothetical protein